MNAPTLLPAETELALMAWLHRTVSAEQWMLITRLGESTILLPAVLVLLLWLWRWAGAPALALRWALALTLATALVTASKVAFFGFEVGYAPWNYTGLSGHAMFACAVLPLLLLLSLDPRRSGLRRLLLLAGAGLAAVIAISRVPLGAHSWIEVIAGAAAGGAVTAWALRGRHTEGGWPARRVPPVLPLLLLLWLALMPVRAPASPTHGWVLKLSTWVAGRDRPYTRKQMLRRWRAEERARALRLQQP